MSSYHALAKSANIGATIDGGWNRMRDSWNRSWNQTAAQANNIGNALTSPFQGAGAALDAAGDGAARGGLGGFVQGAVDGWGRGMQNVGRNKQFNDRRYAAAGGGPARSMASAVPQPPASPAAPPAFAGPMGPPDPRPQGPSAPSAYNALAQAPQSGPVGGPPAQGSWQQGDPSRGGWQGGGLPLADAAAGQPYRPPAAPPAGGAYQAIGQSPASSPPPDYQALFRNTHGSDFNPNSRMDREKLQQMQQFGQANPQFASASPNTFARNFYRR